jgi:hypothetical protein
VPRSRKYGSIRPHSLTPSWRSAYLVEQRETLPFLPYPFLFAKEENASTLLRHAFSYRQVRFSVTEGNSLESDARHLGIFQYLSYIASAFGVF